MVIDGVRIRHQQRTQPRRRQLGNRQRAGTANHQVGIAVGGHHVGNKFHAFGFHAQRVVIRLQAAQLAPTRLVIHLRARIVGQQSQSLRYGFVQNVCTQTAADHQYFQTTFTPLEAFGRRRQIGNIGADGVADQAAFVAERFRKSVQHPLRPARQLAVGQTCHGVLLVNHNRHAAQFRRQAAGKGNEAAETDDALDAVFPDNPLRFADGFIQSKRQHQLAFDAVAAHAFNRQRFEQDVVLRHDTLFHRAFAAQPNHMMAARAQ